MLRIFSCSHTEVCPLFTGVLSERLSDTPLSSATLLLGAAHTSLAGSADPHDPRPVVRLPAFQLSTYLEYFPAASSSSHQPRRDRHAALSSGGGYSPQGGLTDLAAKAALTTAEIQCQAAGARSVGR